MTNTKPEAYSVKTVCYNGGTMLVCTCGCELDDISENLKVSSTGYNAPINGKTLEICRMKCRRGHEVSFYA